MRVTAGVEALWVLLILASIIARVIKAAKEQKPGKGSSPESDGDYKASSSDLKDFLESLSGSKPAKPSAGVDSPAQARGQIAPARQTAKRAQTPRVARSAQAAPQRVAPVATPRSVAPPPRQAVAPVRQRRERPVPVAAPRIVPPVKPSPVKSSPPEIPKTVKHAAVARQEKTTRMSRDIFKSLRNIDSTRKAIVLREILGPPMALTR